MQLPYIDPNDPDSIRRAFQKLNAGLGGQAKPVFVGLTLTELTSSSLIYPDNDGLLTSLGAATDGQIPIGDTGGIPILGTISGVANEIDVVNGAGTITIGLINPLIVGKGGTGAATLTDHGILLGSGTGAITPLGVATNGQLPIGSAGVDPVLATISGTANEIDVTNGAGTITLSFSDIINLGASI